MLHPFFFFFFLNVMLQLLEVMYNNNIPKICIRLPIEILFSKKILSTKIVLYVLYKPTLEIRTFRASVCVYYPTNFYDNCKKFLFLLVFIDSNLSDQLFGLSTKSSGQYRTARKIYCEWTKRIPIVLRRIISYR